MSLDTIFGIVARPGRAANDFLMFDVSTAAVHLANYCAEVATIFKAERRGDGDDVINARSIF